MFISYKILHTECQHIYYVSLFQQNMIKSSKTLYYIDYGIKLRTGLMLYLIIIHGQVVKQSSRLAVVTQLASQHACIVFIDLVEEGSNKSNFCHSKKNKSCRCRVLLSICVKENYTFNHLYRIVSVGQLMVQPVNCMTTCATDRHDGKHNQLLL